MDALCFDLSDGPCVGYQKDVKIYRGYKNNVYSVQIISLQILTRSFVPATCLKSYKYHHKYVYACAGAHVCMYYSNNIGVCSEYSVNTVRDAHYNSPFSGPFSVSFQVHFVTVA